MMTTGWFVPPLSAPDTPFPSPQLRWWEKFWLFFWRRDPIAELKSIHQLIHHFPTDTETLRRHCKHQEANANTFDHLPTFSESPHFWAYSGLLWHQLASQLWQGLTGQPVPERTIEEEQRWLCGLFRWTKETLHPWHKLNEEALTALQKAYQNFEVALQRTPAAEEAIEWKSPDSRERYDQQQIHNWLKSCRDHCFRTICQCPWKEEASLQWCRSTRPGDPISELEYIEYLSQAKPLRPDQDLHLLYERERHILDLLETIHDGGAHQELLLQRALHRLQLIETLLEVRRQTTRWCDAEIGAKIKGNNDSLLAKWLIGRKLYRTRLDNNLCRLIPDLCRTLTKIPTTLDGARSLNEELSPTLLEEAKGLWKKLYSARHLPSVKQQLSPTRLNNLKPIQICTDHL